MHTLRHVALLALRTSAFIGMALMAGGCSKTDSPAQVDSTDQATQTYGSGVQPNAAITYQPDVVLVGGGPKSIRYASADGLVWVIDGHAEHAKDLQPGKLMILTSRAAGRIMKIEPRGEDLAVTLGPMQLGDVLREADIKVDAKLNPQDMVIQAVPEVPYMYKDYHASAPRQARERARIATPNSNDDVLHTVVHFLPISEAKANDVPLDRMPAATKATAKVTVRDYEIELSSKSDNPMNNDGSGSNRQRIGIKILRNFGSFKAGSGKGGLKAGIDVSLYVRNLRFKSRTVYHEGKVDQESTSILLEGIEQVDVSISSGIEKAVGDNQKIRIEVPVEFAKPCPAYGLPLMCQIKFKFLFETALGGNNATLSTSAGYKLDGPIGFEGGHLAIPGVVAMDQIAEAMRGLSPGVSGLVFSIESRVLTGLGVPAFFGGPYAKLTLAFGLTHSAGASLGLNQDCHAANVKFDVGVGVGAEFAAPEIAALQKLLGKSTDQSKAQGEVFEHTATAYRHDFFAPQKQVCQF